MANNAFHFLSLSILQLTWMDGSGNKISSGVKNTKETLPDGKRVTAKSVLKLKPLKHHHNTTVSCQAKNTSDKSVKTAQIKIEVNTLNSIPLTYTIKHFRICHHRRYGRTHPLTWLRQSASDGE